MDQERYKDLDWHSSGLLFMVGGKLLDTWISIKAMREVPWVLSGDPVPAQVYTDNPLLAMWVLTGVAILMLVVIVEYGIRYTVADDVWMYGLGYWVPGVLWTITAVNNATVVARAVAMF